MGRKTSSLLDFQAALNAAATMEELVPAAMRIHRRYGAEVAAISLQQTELLSGKRAADALSYQAQFRAETALKRERDTRIDKGDTKGAQAITDFLDLRKLTGDYAANGLSSKQAKDDFATNLRAQARLNQPSITVDSLQSVGAGGGISPDSGNNIAQRIAAISADQLTVLKRIDDAVRTGSRGID